jgi:hypothetical protein
MNVNREELKFVKKKPGDTCKASLEKKRLINCQHFSTGAEHATQWVEIFFDGEFSIFCTRHSAVWW